MIELAGVMGMLMGPGGDAEAEEDEDRAGAGSAEDGADGLTDENLVLMSEDDDPERPPEWDYLPLDPWDDPPEEEDPAPDRGPRSSDDDSLLPPFLRAIDGLQPVVPAAGGEGAGTGATLEGPDPASGALRVAYDPQDHPDPQLSVEPAGPDGAVRVLLDGAVIARLEDAEGLAAEDLALVARPGA